MLLAALDLGAQTVLIEGKVTDASSAPVPGAAVFVRGAEKAGVITATDGTYALKTSAGGDAVICVSCIGFREIEEAVGGRSKIDFVLEEDAEQLEEVVVVGYGAMRKSDLTGALSSLKIDAEEAARSLSMSDMLEGGVSGVQILTESTAPDAGVSLQIRGLNSFSTSTEPLYVVDGVIIDGDAESMDTSLSIDSSRGATDTRTSGLSSINPNDIASIEILKDASATAIYGSQGANGVVLITTKSATRDKPVVTFSAGVDLSVRDKRLDILTFDEYVEYLEKALPNTTAQKILSGIYNGYNGPEDRGTVKVTPIDWQDYLLRTAVTQRYGFSIMGRPKGYNYLFSLGYKDNIGVLKGTDSRSFNIRLNLDRTFSKDTKIGIKLNGAYVYSNLVNGSNVGGLIRSGSSMLRSMLSSRPYVPVSPETELDDIEDEDFQYGPNRWIQNYKNNITRYEFQPSAYVQAGLLKWLVFKSTIGGDFKLSDRVDARTYKITRFGTTACVGRSLKARYNWDNTLLFRKSFGKHKLSGTLGTALSSEYSFGQMNHGWYLLQPYAEEYDINSAEPQNTYYAYAEESSSLMSGFARAVYSFDERYVLTATMRLDGSSKFRGGNKWSEFPSFAFAWRPTSEPWFNLPAVSNMKLRIGWGQVGNQRIPNYQTTQTYGFIPVGNHSLDSGISIGVYPTNIPNPDLKWETSQQVNAGLDLSLFSGRIAFTADAYIKDTRDLLQQKYIAKSSGFSTMYVNSGALRNKGLEFNADFVPVSAGGLEWTLGGNISFNRNTIVSVGQESTSGEIYLTPDKPRNVRYFGGAAINNEATDFLNINIEGHPVGLFYGYVLDGIVQAGETAPYFEEATATEGMRRYRDLNNDGLINEADRTIIGDPHPDFTYGFYTAFSFKGLSLKARFVGSQGADIYNLNNISDYQTIYTRNVRKTVLANAYSADNPGGTQPAIGKSKPIEFGKNSSVFVEDGSYLNLKTVSLSYRLPAKKISRHISAIDAGISCGNVFMLTNYSGWNPKSKSSGVSRMGVEVNSYPSARTFSFDLKVQF